jgi:hypothetical protein
VPPQWLGNSADEAWVDAAEAALHNAHKPLTAYSVFTGMVWHSSIQATERLHLPLKFIGYCEVDDDASTELETLFPGIWLDRATIRFRVFGPSSFNTALQLVLRPHFLVHFV